MRPIILLILSLTTATLVAQSDFRLSTAAIPKLNDAISPLPTPLSDVALRDSLGSNVLLKADSKVDEILRQVVNSLKTHEFEGSLSRLEYLQSFRPTDSDLLILRGCIYAESGHPEAAEPIFNRAILIAPMHPWARLNLAEAQMSQKKYGEAEKTLAILSSARPDSEVIRFKLILALVLQKKYAAAEAELKYLEEHVTTPAYYFARAAIAFAKGDKNLGEEMMDRAKKNYSEVQNGYFYNAIAAYSWVPAS